MGINFLVPLKSIEAAEIVKALRRHVSLGGLGKPDLFLLDGGAEFKGRLREAVTAWSSKARVHAPHHHQSAGMIEVYTKGAVQANVTRKW